MPLDSAALTQHIERRHERLRDWRQVALKEFEKLVAEESRYGDIVFTENTEVPANNAAKLLRFIQWCVRVATASPPPPPPPRIVTAACVIEL